jgi:hypothetical protein
VAIEGRITPLIKVILAAVTAPFKKGLSDAKAETKKFKADVEKGGGLFGGLGKIVAGGAILAQIKSVIDLGGELRDSADNAGISVEAMQKLQGAFADSGASAEVVTRGIAEMSQAMSEALSGNEKTRQSFEDLGVSLDDIIEKADNPEQMAIALAEGFKNAADKGRALEALQDILGKSAKRMAAGMRGGGKELEEAFNKSTAATEDQVNAVDSLGDKLGQFVRKAKTMGMQTIAGLMGKGPRFNLDAEDPAKQAEIAERKAAAERQKAKNEERRREQIEQSMRQKDNATREKRAQEALTQDQRRENIITGFAAGSSTTARAGELKQRIQQSAAMAATGSAEGRANLADALTERAAMLTAQNLMSPDERREARRAEGRTRRARNKAMRQVEKEAAAAAAAAPATDNKAVVDAVNETKTVLGEIKTKLNDLTKGGLK